MDGFGMGFGGGLWVDLDRVMILAVAWALGGLRTWRSLAKKARELLDQRFARGEIDEEEYRKRRVLWIASHGVGALSWPSTLRRTVCGFSFLTRFGRRPVHMNTTSKDSGDMSTIVERVFQGNQKDAPRVAGFHYPSDRDSRASGCRSRLPCSVQSVCDTT